MRTCPRHQTSLFFSFYTIVPHSIKKQYFFINRKGFVRDDQKRAVGLVNRNFSTDHPDPCEAVLLVCQVADFSYIQTNSG